MIIIILLKSQFLLFYVCQHVTDSISNINKTQLGLASNKNILPYLIITLFAFILTYTYPKT